MEIDEYAAGVRNGELAHDPLALARFIVDRSVVAFGEHFLLIDKPCNLSVWGHARSASSHITVLSLLFLCNTGFPQSNRFYYSPSVS